MPSALSLCLFALAARQLIWADGRWEIGPLKHLTTMLNTDTIARARANTHTERKPYPRTPQTPAPYVRILNVCVCVCDVWSGTHTHTHGNRVVTSLSCHSQQLSCVVCDNKRGWWARSDTLPPTRHSLNAYESQVEACRCMACVCVCVCVCVCLLRLFNLNMLLCVCVCLNVQQMCDLSIIMWRRSS